MANIITACRVVGSMLLLFFPLFSSGFYITYLLCGFSDMIDGTVARKTNSTSSSGAKFDSIADFVFMIIVCYKCLPVIQIALWLWIWIILIAIVKSSNIIWGLIRKKSLLSIHSTLNKITGFVLFLLPLTIPFIALTYSLSVCCLLATFAAIQEHLHIRTNRESI